METLGGAGEAPDQQDSHSFRLSCLSQPPALSIKDDINNLLMRDQTPITSNIHAMLMCELCQGFVYDPLKCESCEQLYCGQEIQMWLTQNGRKCPHCQEVNPKFKPIGRFEKEVIGKTQVDGCSREACEKRNKAMLFDDSILFVYSI